MASNAPFDHKQLTNLMTSWWTEPISPHSGSTPTTGYTLYQKHPQWISEDEKLVQQYNSHNSLVFTLNPGRVNSAVWRILFRKGKLSLQVILNYSETITQIIKANCFYLLLQCISAGVSARKRPTPLLFTGPLSPRDPSLEQLTQVLVIIHTFLANTLSLNLLQTLLSCETVGL